jgi:TonB family protein
MLTILTTFALTVTPLAVMRPDTPPPFPIAVETLKSREDIIAASRLTNWTQAPSDLVLPQVTNSTQVLAYIANHYPANLRDSGISAMPWVWVFIDQRGIPASMSLLKTSGNAALDSLGLAALALARFEPALVAGRAVGLRTPIPIQVSYQAAASAPPNKPLEDGPVFTPYTVNPVLLNRDEVNRALIAAYPPKLREAKVGGTAQVWLLLDENGSVIKSQIRTSSGNSQLDRAALSVSESMRFSPAKQDDKAVRVWILMPFAFKTIP